VDQFQTDRISFTPTASESRSKPAVVELGCRRSTGGFAELPERFARVVHQDRRLRLPERDIDRSKASGARAWSSVCIRGWKIQLELVKRKHVIEEIMSDKLPRKALIAVSGFNGAIYPGGGKTGVFFVEALHPYEVLAAAGFEVDLASETGTCGFDDVSLTPPFLSGSDRAILNNSKHPFMVKIKSQLKKASDLRKEDYGFFFASAGHSALYDYPTAKALQAMAADIWNRGGVVGATCHGPAILPGVIDSKTGKSIIHGKTVTGFTIEGELIFRILDKLRADGVIPIVEAVTAAGAFYSGSTGAFDDYSITSGRVVTGTNPASSRSATERGVKVFDNLELP
jgi:putative intracellular protease/amidase